MKGFPNQVVDLNKLSLALEVLHQLISEELDARDDGIFGETLVRRGVLSTGRTKKPTDAYLAEQRKKPTSNQSHRTTARGLRELFRVMGLIDDSHGSVKVLPLGQAVAAKSGVPAPIMHWRRALVSMTHFGGDSAYSHPYQVLLNLIARVPGIPRAKCSLALEAENDTLEELNRIVELATLEEDVIRTKLKVTKPNWDNAKKVLPSLAEQVGDAFKDPQGRMWLASGPGAALADGRPEGTSPGKKALRASKVSADTIAMAGSSDEWDENIGVTDRELDPATIIARKAKLKDRHARHNAIVRQIAKVLQRDGISLYENPFDCLAVGRTCGLMIEVKSLDGTPTDEAARVREALAQLLYYEAFALRHLTEKKRIIRLAIFEHNISEEHTSWLTKLDVHVLWPDGGGSFCGTEEALATLDQLTAHASS